MKVRLRSATVYDASQWFKPGDHPAVTRKMLAEGGRSEYGIIPGEEILVMPGDWVITSPTGKHVALRDDIFHNTYEEVA